MKIVMDADCLIKLTKSQLKEVVCRAFDVFVPEKVVDEVMIHRERHLECDIVQKNLDASVISKIAEINKGVKGEEAALSVFLNGAFDAVASDDRKFIRKLKLHNLPYITPGVLIFVLVRDKVIDLKAGFAGLERLSKMISEAETALVKIKLDQLDHRKDDHAR